MAPCVVLAAAAHAFGQAVPDPSVIGVDPRTIRWHAQDLGILASRSATASTDSYVATGISQTGVVVGYVQGLTIEPWVWFPCDSVSFGFPAGQMIALRPPSGSLADARAYDVNSSGVIVGFADLAGGGTRPVYWSLSSAPPTITMTQLGTQNGVAHAVNDAAGGWDIVLETGSVPCGIRTPFRYRQGEPPTTLRTLALHTGDSTAYALDVSTPLFGQQPITVGYAEDPCVFSCSALTAVDAVRWSLPAVHPPDPVPDAFREDFATNPADPQPLNLWRAQALGVNSQRQSVGSYASPATNCLPRAVFWRFNKVAIDLGSAPPALTAGSRTTAMAISNSFTDGGVTIVGRNDDPQTGVIWWRPSTSSAPGSAAFSAVTTDMLCAATIPGLPLLRELVDINAKGWMIGNGEVAALSPRRAYLLRPNPCPIDLSGDFVVNAADQALVLGAWTPAGSTCSGCCPADLNGDGVVGSGDLAIVLGAWGTTCTSCIGAGGLPASGFFESTVGEWVVNDESVDAALSLFGFTSAPEFSAWLSELDEAAQAAALTAFNDVLYQYSLLQGGDA